MTARRPLRIANASGFYGDRFGAVREMLTGGPLDVLTGDYLAELTMLILGRDRLKDPGLGYAKTFLRQLEEGLGLAHERGVRIVTNAGGLNPAGLADAVRALARKVGVPVRVAHVEGDDLMRPGAAGDAGAGVPAGDAWAGVPAGVVGPGVPSGVAGAGVSAGVVGPGVPAGDAWPGVPAGALTANAYLGGAGITACLRAGADVVVTGRVTDAALVSGPAAWWFGWGPEEYDRLAGAVVAGHVLECGTQATGGNYAFFTAHDVRRPGYPLAEVREDGSAVITKHPGTGGLVSPGTVTAQLLYETQGARYLGPDVTARLDTVRLTPDGTDRVRISGTVGEPPPDTLKVGVTRVGGWRNEVVFVLTGLDVEAKAALVREQLADALEGVAEAAWTLARTDHADADTQETAGALLRLVVRDPSPERVGRQLTSAAVELALASYPGFHITAPPGPAQPYGVFTSALAPAGSVPHVAVLPDGTRLEIAPAPTTAGPPDPPPPSPRPAAVTDPGDGAALTLAPLGLLAGARSGDKGGDANIGVWVESDAAWEWLRDTLTVEALQTLLPETAPLSVARHELPNLRALNFTIAGLLGDGVASGHRFDPQAKALGEWLRSRHVPVPAHLLPSTPEGIRP
ncbi:acyclic terpene utilization AtuA family protein [Streptomyces sp. NPDC005180]|uniref:acyclic terpene utilization AtuA family protein n=1 Tax=Streptomyces sp. NPDC005180 TaxID=3156868 RepID=UPI0033A60CB4